MTRFIAFITGQSISIIAESTQDALMQARSILGPTAKVQGC